MTGQQQSIGAGQLYCIAFMSRPIVMLSLNSAVLGGNNAVDNTVSAGIGLLLSLISAIPVFWLCSRYPALNILDIASGAMGRVGLLVPILYLLYFILMGCYYVSFFAVFIGNVMDPKMPAWLIALGVIAVSCYGAKRGLEAIARASGFVIAAILLGVLFILCTLVPEIRTENYRPLLYDGSGQAWEGARVFLARGTVIPMLAFLLPAARGKKKAGFVLWCVLTAAVFGLLILILSGALGNFLNTQLFPVYTASSLSRIGPIQRMDALFLAIWMAGLVIELSAIFHILALCGRKMQPKWGGNTALFGGAALVFGGAVWTASSIPMQGLLFGKELLYPASALAALGIPLLVLITDYFRKKCRRGTGNGKKIAVGLLVLLLVTLTGCQGQVTLNRRMLVKGISIDYADGQYDVFVHASVMEDEKSETILYEGSGDSILEALNEVVQYSGKTPMYTHSMFLLLGEGCGKAGIQNVMDFFVRYYETRASVNIFYYEGKAETIASLKDDAGTYPLAEEADMLTDVEKVAGRSITANVVDVVNGLCTEGRSAFLPVLETEGKSVLADGTAYFRDGIFAGILDGDATCGTLLLMNRFQYGAVVIPSGEGIGEVALSLRDTSCQIEAQIRNDAPHFQISLQCEADISEITQGLGKKMNREYYKKFENALNQRLEEQITAAIETAAVQKGCDIFGLSSFLQQQQPDFWRAHAQEWEEILKDLSYTVTVRSNVNRMEEEITPVLH